MKIRFENRVSNCFLHAKSSQIEACQINIVFVSFPILVTEATHILPLIDWFDPIIGKASSSEAL